MATGMASGFIRSYRDLMENRSDERVQDWFLMSSPFPISCLILSYIWFVKYGGPKWMEKREPYDLRMFLKFYNAFQICYNGWLFLEGLIGWSSSIENLGCAKVDYSYQPFALKVTGLVWWYFILKLTELTDTITFVLRKKTNHVSNLHVLHHSIMPMSAWVGVKFVAGGHTTFLGFLNAGVHVIMYSYYFLSSFGPKMQKYLMWKRHITSLQMCHFLVIMLHSLQLLPRKDCEYSKVFATWIVIQAIMFYVLFSKFYKQNYGQREPLSAMFQKKAE